MKKHQKSREKSRRFFSPKKGILLKIEKGVIEWWKNPYFRTNARLPNSTKYHFLASNKCTLGKQPSEPPFYAGKKGVGLRNPVTPLGV